ncbi:hypothetical protein ACFL1Z_09580 [Thermodesulfobacteriota bacterium]
MNNQNCRHNELVLLDSKENKLRCLHCHLTIDKNELTYGYCPECYEVDGVKRNDFEAFNLEDESQAQYFCEKCGALIPG